VGGSARIFRTVVIISSSSLVACGGSTPDADVLLNSQPEKRELTVKVSEGFSTQVSESTLLSGKVLEQGMPSENASVEWEKQPGAGQT